MPSSSARSTGRSDTQPAVADSLETAPRRHRNQPCNGVRTDRLGSFWLAMETTASELISPLRDRQRSRSTGSTVLSTIEPAFVVQYRGKLLAPPRATRISPWGQAITTASVGSRLN